jgi:signal peptidase
MKVVNWIVTSVLAIAVIGFAFLYFVPGYNLYLVRSESMRPTINLGDLIVTGPPGRPIAGEAKPGTVITFEYNNELVTHRIHSIEGQTLITKGDAVEDPDPWPVSMSDIRGVYLFKVPYVGYVTSFVQTKLGWFLMIIIPAMCLVLWLAKDIVKEALSNA